DVEVNRLEDGGEGIFYSCFFHPDCSKLNGLKIEEIETILKSMAWRHITKTREITMDMRLPSIKERQYIF
ncbi:MAG: hypothetical protein ACPL7I_07805, partial [Myxococcota bacterium]